MDFLTIFGYIIAALVIALGLYLIFKKNAETQAETLPEEAEDEIKALSDEDISRVPVVPRAVREHILEKQLDEPAVSITPSRVEPQVEIEGERDALNSAVFNTSIIARSPTVSQPVEPAKPDAFDQALAQLEAVTQSEVTETRVTETRVTGTATSIEPTDVEALSHAEIEVAVAPGAVSLNPTVETANVDQWQGESALLNAHLQDQERRDDETALAQAEHILALYVMPTGRPLSGDKVMHLLRQFGLRYGEMSLFHRFLDSNGTGPLMFSVLRYTSEGPMGFDLETLSNEQVEGLAFFLALPNKHALAGYDTMVSISGLLAREVSGHVYDEHMNELTPQLREHYRHFVLDYRGSAF